MSHINLNDVTCPTDSELTHIDMHNDAISNLLSGGWIDFNAGRVQRGRPLKATDFENYTILPIWGSEDSYMSGAVIAFVKPSERALPNERYGFGAYVHVGTNATFTAGDVPTDGDYWRGYAGAAAAVWTEVLGCVSTEVTKEHIVTDQFTGELIDYAYCGLTVTPVITDYAYLGGEYIINIDFDILGSMKTNFSKTIGKVDFYMGYLPDGCQVMMDSYKSKNGYKYDKPTMSIDWGVAAKWGLKALIFLGGFYATGGAALVLKGIGGAMLFSDLVSLNPTITDVTNGVDELEPPNHYVDFKYDPLKTMNNKMATLMASFNQ